MAYRDLTLLGEIQTIKDKLALEQLKVIELKEEIVDLKEIIRKNKEIILKTNDF